MKVTEVLSSDPEILSGAVVFKGTRVPVEALFENLSGGMSSKEFLKDFPSVAQYQVETVLRLAAEKSDCLFGIMACDHARLILCAAKLSKMRILVRSDRNEATSENFAEWWSHRNGQGVQCFWWRNNGIRHGDVIWELVLKTAGVHSWGVWRIISDEFDPADGHGIRRRTCIPMPFDPNIFGSGNELEDASPFAHRVANSIATENPEELDDGVLIDSDEIPNIIRRIRGDK